MKFHFGLVFILLMTSSAHAEKWLREGKIYLPGKTDGAPLFTQKIEIETMSDVDLTSVSSISDSDGQVVMRESARIEKGLIVEQSVEQLQINEVYELKRQDGKVTYRTFKIEGTEKKLTEEKSEVLPKRFVTGPGTEMFLKSQRELLAAGKTVQASFGIFEISRSVDFAFTQLSEPSSKNQKPGIKIKMKVDSFFLSFVVDPIVMVFDPEHFHLVNFVGRTPVRIKKGKEWKPLDAEIIYKTTRVLP